MQRNLDGKNTIDLKHILDYYWISNVLQCETSNKIHENIDNYNNNGNKLFGNAHRYICQVVNFIP